MNRSLGQAIVVSICVIALSLTLAGCGLGGTPSPGGSTPGGAGSSGGEGDVIVDGATLPPPDASKGATSSDEATRGAGAFKARLGKDPKVTTAISAAASKYVQDTSGFKPDTFDIVAVKWAKAASGELWATCQVDPKAGNLDGALVIMRKKPDGKWRVEDLGTGLEPTELPAEVRGLLWPQGG